MATGDKLVNLEVLKETVQKEVVDLKSAVINDNYEVTDNLVDFEFDFADWSQGSPAEPTATYMVHNINRVTLTEGEKIYTVFKNVNYPAGTVYAALWVYDVNNQLIATGDLLYKNMTPSSYTVPSGAAYGYVGFNTKSTGRVISPQIVADWNADIYIGKTNVNNNTWYKKYIPICKENAESIDTIESELIQNNIYGISWENKIYYPNTGWSNSNTRIASNALTAKFRTQVKCNNGYKYGVNVWTDETLTVRISDTGWMTGNYMIPEGTIFTLSVAKQDDSAVTPSDGANIYIASVPETDIGKSYFYAGNVFPYKKHGYNVQRLFGKVQPQNTSVIMNGGSVFNGKIFQAYNADVMQIYDLGSGSLLNEFACKCDHGDCVSFSGEYYDESDTYPLLYCSADTTPAKIYVNRVTETSSTLVRTLVFPLSAGYYGGQVIDTNTNTIYIIAYTTQNYQTDANNNKVKITAWDLNALTDNGDNTYTPAFKSEKEIPFIYCCQDQTLLNGMILIISSQSYAVQPTKLYAIDEYSYDIANVFDDLPANLLTTEAEMISHGEENGAYYLIVGANNGYYKVTFE